MAHVVDGTAKDQVFQTAVAMRGHYQKIGVEPLHCFGNFLGRAAAMLNHDFHLNVVFAQNFGDAIQVFFPFGHFGGGSKRAVHPADNTFFDMEQN